MCNKCDLLTYRLTGLGMFECIVLGNMAVRLLITLSAPSITVQILLLLLLLAFTTHLRVLASSFLRFRDHTQ
jgi:hypothetical protein